MYADLDIGYAWDDYLGCDTLLNAFYGYNGDDYDNDDTVNSFIPTYGYRAYPPAQGIVFLNHPMHSFIGYSNYSGVSGDPSGAEEMYNSMKGLWKDGTPITVGGNGIGGMETTRYLYSGDPSNPEEWSEVTAGNNPQDRRAIAASGPFDLGEGDTLQLDLAFVFAQDYEGDHLNSVALLKERIEQVRWYYENDTLPCGKNWSRINSKINPVSEIQISPNPVEDVLWVRYPSKVPHFKDISYSIVNVFGLKVAEGNFMPESRLDLRYLTPGMYLIVFKTGDQVSVHKFVKN
jgi:hypothetical protein